MKVNLSDGKQLVLTLSPTCSPDELLIASLTRLFIKGGKITISSPGGKELSYSSLAAATVTEDGLRFNDFLEFLP